MSYATVIIDGKVTLDGDLKHWAKQPPEFILQLLDPKTKPQPWLKGAGMCLAEAVMRDEPITIDITTAPDGWTMNVRYSRTPTLTITA